MGVKRRNAATPRILLKGHKLIVAALVANAVSVPEQTVKGGRTAGH
jgi:hypothetical protein